MLSSRSAFQRWHAARRLVLICDGGSLLSLCERVYVCVYGGGDCLRRRVRADDEINKSGVKCRAAPSAATAIYEGRARASEREALVFI